MYLGNASAALQARATVLAAHPTLVLPSEHEINKHRRDIKPSTAECDSGEESDEEEHLAKPLAGMLLESIKCKFRAASG